MNRELLDELFLSTGNVKEVLLCIYCERILLQPQHSKCGHRFCKTCLENLKTEISHVCPRCNIIIDDIQDDYGALREINEIEVKCPKNGCNYSDKLAEMDNHNSLCHKSEERRTNSNVYTYTQKGGSCMDMKEKMDIAEEIINIKKNIEILMLRKHEEENLEKKYENLKSIIEGYIQSNEEITKNFMDDTKESYKKIEEIVNLKGTNENCKIKTDNYDTILQEISDLKKTQTLMKEEVQKNNKNIKEKMSQLYSKIKNIENDKKEKFLKLYEEVDYLNNEFSSIKTVNEKKVIKFYNKTDIDVDELKYVSTFIPELYERINSLKKKVTYFVENQSNCHNLQKNALEKEVYEINLELGLLKIKIKHLSENYPISVFLTVYFREGVGMNMSLREVEVFYEQLESSNVAMKEELSHISGCNGGSLIMSKRILRRKPAFTMSDRKKRTIPKDIDEV